MTLNSPSRFYHQPVTNLERISTILGGGLCVLKYSLHSDGVLTSTEDHCIPRGGIIFSLVGFYCHPTSKKVSLIGAPRLSWMTMEKSLRLARIDSVPVIWLAVACRSNRNHTDRLVQH